MGILHRISRGERERKGHGLNGDPPMPADPGSARDDGFSGLSEADKALLELARVAVFSPAAAARGAALAKAMRQQRDGMDDAGLLTGLLPVLHWMEGAGRQNVFPGLTWPAALNAVLAACQELDGGGDE